MKIYTIKIALKGISPMVWRRICVAGNTSLADLHYIVQTLFGWDNEYLHQFHIYGKDYGISYEGGLYYPDNPHTVYLDSFSFDKGDKFTYEFNFFEHIMHDFRIEEVKETIDTKVHPWCIKGSGMPGVTKSDEINAMADFIQAISDEEKKTSRKKLLNLIEAIDTMRFNRKKLNHQLEKLPMDAYTCKSTNDGETS
jgi:hypothetical protein